MDELRTYVESLRTTANSIHVDYILTNWLDRGKSAKQMRASFRQTLEAKQWQAAHGPLEYRASNGAAAKLFAEVIIYLNSMIES
jgi:hypothetical protein